MYSVSFELTQTLHVGKMAVDNVSLLSQNILLLVPLVAVVTLLLVFVGPWMFEKASAPFFGGGHMDLRGPGRWPRRMNHTRQRDGSPLDNYGNRYRASYPGNNRANQHTEDSDTQYMFRDWQQQPQQEFFESNDDDDEDDSEEDSDAEEESDSD